MARGRYPTPKLAPGAAAKLVSRRAGPDTQRALGFPGELVEDWETVAVAAMGEAVAERGALRLFLDACMKCGACTDKCHYFLGTGDPKNMPVARQDLVRQANWQKVGGASPPGRRSNQTTFLREPCVGSREGAGEASVAVRMGRAIEHRKGDGPECRGFQIGRRQHRRHRFGEMSASSAVSENPCTFARLVSGPWEVFKLPRMS